MFSMTKFQNLSDTNTGNRLDFETISDFEQFFIDEHKNEYESKSDAPLITPAMYKDTNASRLNDNVSHWARWTALDIDYWDKDDYQEYFAKKLKGFKYIMYSTASSTIEEPKFRLVIPTQNQISSLIIPKFWHSLNKMMGKSNDKQVKDLTRIYYVPGQYKSSNNNFLFISEGEKFISHSKIIHKYPYPQTKTFFDELPQNLQEDLMEHRKLRLVDEHGMHSWNHYSQCKFFPKKLAEEYKSITETGWYHKSYCIMVAIAHNALKEKYPISSFEIAQMCKEFYLEVGPTGRYNSRNWEKEATSALEYAYK